MASIKEAFDSTMKEAFAGIKLMIWALPMAIALASVIYGGFLGAVVGNIVLAAVAFLFFGLCVTVSHNVIVKKDTILPSFNIVEMFINGAMAVVAALPYAIVGGLLYWGVVMLFAAWSGPVLHSEFYAEHPLYTMVFTLTFLELIGLFIAAIPITGIVIFVRRLNILEAFNIKKYFFALGETFLSYTTFTIRFVLLAMFVFGFMFYLFYLFIGFENSFWIYLLVLLCLTYQLFLFNAIAQISDDIFTFAEKEEQKQKEDAMIKKMLENHQ